MSLRLAVPRLNAGTGNMTTVIDLGTVPDASGREARALAAEIRGARQRRETHRDRKGRRLMFTSTFLV